MPLAVHICNAAVPLRKYTDRRTEIKRPVRVPLSAFACLLAKTCAFPSRDTAGRPTLAGGIYTKPCAYLVHAVHITRKASLFHSPATAAQCLARFKPKNVGPNPDRVSMEEKHERPFPHKRLTCVPSSETVASVRSLLHPFSHGAAEVPTQD